VIEVRRTTSASADRVWNVLADGWTYPAWVVGAARMRSVGADWPAVGAELHHSLGSWPLLLNDVTRVLEARVGRELVLYGHGLPVGDMQIHLLLEPRADGGSEIVMREDAVAGPARLIPLPVRAVLVRRRNTEALRRLAYLAEGGAR
jgi:hypothetical protein